MSYPKLLKQTFATMGVQRAKPSAGVWGVPHILLFPFLPAAGGARKKKKDRGHPCNPGKGLAAPCNPACRAD
ncbi:hypothetical protein KDI_36920 [Dictyobacter arantiisoli]|uniref:Uncharacterized protein n=1 Tax=Dictyobacter arantiisoli TaxID=2014874 RepID=A0A5A5TFV3_9CHLR|nr:hypothetical protein KDI_36920 [Dictyobacter arantiisoli]